jgi:hypothetical protein
MPSIETKFILPPGPIGYESQQSLIELFFGDNKVFEPNKYGRNDGDTAIGETNRIETLVDFWQHRGRLTVTGKPASHFICFFDDPKGETSWNGFISWCAPLKVVNDRWKSKHQATVAAAMKLVNSPLAFSGLEDDIETKCWRWIEEPGGGERKTPTLTSPIDGFPGMFWRMFLSNTVVDSLPAVRDAHLATSLQVSDYAWLLSPYDDPREAQTPAGQALEQQLIQAIGPDYFYDHQTLTPPSQRLIVNP